MLGKPRRLAYSHPADGKQELPPLGMCRLGLLLEVFLQQLHCPLIQFRFLAGSLAWSQSAALIEPFAVTFECCTVHYTEALSGLAFETPFFTASTIFFLRSNEYAFMQR